MTHQIYAQKNIQLSQKSDAVVIPITPEIKQNVDDKTRNKLVQEYRKLFLGLAMAKWTRKHSWGVAWQNAIGVCGALIMVAKQKMTPNNHAVQYMENIHQAYKKYWAKTAMTHPERDTKTKMGDKALKQMHDYAIKNINNATNSIMEILARYNEREQEKVIERDTLQKAPTPNKQAIKTAPQSTQQPPQNAPADPTWAPGGQETKQPSQNAPQNTQTMPRTAPHQQVQAAPTVKPVANSEMQNMAQPVTRTQPVAMPQMERPAKPMAAQAYKPAQQKNVAPEIEPRTVTPQAIQQNAKSPEQETKVNTAPPVRQQAPVVPLGHENKVVQSAKHTQLKQATMKLQIHAQIHIWQASQIRQRAA